MDLTLTPAQLELQARARAFVRDVLQPREVEFERAGGRVPRDWGEPIRRAAIEARLHGGSFPVELGGQGWSALEQVLVHEQLGQSTGGLWSYIPGPTTSSIHADADQRARYLDPSHARRALRQLRRHRGRRRLGCAGAAATAVRDAATGEYVLNGEKWFVTGPDDTDFMIFHANVIEGERAAADPVPRRLRRARGPRQARPRLHAHVRRPAPAVRARGRARPGRARSSAASGRADELTNEWFVEERIHIGARCAGAMERLLTLAVEWATERVQFGERIYDFQGVSFPLADSAADASAARLLTRECAWLADTGADPKVVHAKASLAKLFASEAAFRCADRVVQVFGGRGYMREFAAGAVLPRAAGRPDLGGHLGDPAADRRPGPREARRGPGGGYDRGCDDRERPRRPPPA